MTEEQTGEKPVEAKKPKTKADKQAEHIVRIKRTVIASMLGILAGLLAYYILGTPDASGIQNDGFLGFMIMLACIVLQKHVFMLIHIDTTKMGAKDWFYQGFMTFAFWFMAWTILLTSMTLVAGFSSNVSSGPAPVAVSFTDTSAGSPVSWLWDFGDGSTTSVRDPVHVYTRPGTFNVSLTVANAAGNTLTRTLTNYISVNATGAA